MNDFFKEVTHHLTGEEVQEYKLTASFFGTHGKKRKVDRQSVDIGTLKASKTLAKTQIELEKDIKDILLSKIKKKNIKLANDKIQVFFYGQTVSSDGIFKRTISDSNLMLNAPKLIYSTKEEKFIWEWPKKYLSLSAFASFSLGPVLFIYF